MKYIIGMENESFVSQEVSSFKEAILSFAEDYLYDQEKYEILQDAITGMTNDEKILRLVELICEEDLPGGILYCYETSSAIREI